MILGIGAAFLSAIFFASHFVITRVAVKRSTDYMVLTSLMNILSGILFIPFLFFETVKFNGSTQGVLFLIVAATLFAIAGVLKFGSNQKIDASLGVIISRATFVVSFMGSIIIIGEALKLNRLIGVIVLLCGIGILFVRNNHSNFLDKKALIFVLVASILYGIGQVFDQVNSNTFSPAIYSGGVTFLVGLLLFAALMVKGKNASDILLELKKNLAFVSLLAITNTLGYYLMIVAYKLIDKSMALPIINSTVAITVILGYIFLHERDHLLRKAISTIVIFAGIIIVSLA
jgi:transporter family protein